MNEPLMHVINGARSREKSPDIKKGEKKSRRKNRAENLRGSVLMGLHNTPS